MNSYHKGGLRLSARVESTFRGLTRILKDTRIFKLISQCANLEELSHSPNDDRLVAGVGRALGAALRACKSLPRKEGVIGQ